MIKRAFALAILIALAIPSMGYEDRENQIERAEFHLYDSGGNLLVSGDVRAYIINADSSLTSNQCDLAFGGADCDSCWVPADTTNDGERRRTEVWSIYKISGPDTLIMSSQEIEGGLAAQASVDSTAIKDNTITDAQIDSLTADALGKDSVTKEEIATDAVGTDEVIDRSLTFEDLARPITPDSTVYLTDSLALAFVATAGTLKVALPIGPLAYSYTIALPADSGSIGDVLVRDAGSSMGWTGTPSLTSLTTTGNLTVGGNASLGNGDSDKITIANAPYIGRLSDKGGIRLNLGDGTNNEVRLWGFATSSDGGYILPPVDNAVPGYFLRIESDSTMNWVPNLGRMVHPLFFGKTATFTGFSQSNSDGAIYNGAGPASSAYFAQPSVGDSLWTETGFALADSVAALESDGYSTITVSLVIHVDTASGMIPWRLALRGWKAGEDIETLPDQDTFDVSISDSTYCQYSTKGRASRIRETFNLSDLDNDDFYVEVKFYRLRNNNASYLYLRNEGTAIVE